MPATTRGFVLSAAKRPSGTPYWLVRGSRNGRQIRREFDNRPDALVFAEQQNSELNGVAPTQSPQLTHLSAEQLHAAEAAVQQLAREFPGVKLLDLVDYHRDLSASFTLEEARRIGPAIKRLRSKYPDARLDAAVDWLVANYRPPKSSLTLRVALENYAADVLRRHESKSLSKPQFDRIGYAMQELEIFFGGDEPLAHLTTPRLQDFLQATTHGKNGGAFSNKTWNNRRGYLTSFFEYCRKEHWIEINAATDIKNYQKKEMPRKPLPAVLTAKQAASLMHHLETFQNGRLVPFYAVCLFAGVRPDWDNGEITKVTREMFKTKHRILKLPAEITKTGKPRDTKLQPNLIAWLEAYPIEQYPIIAVNFRKLHLKIRKEFKLGHDVLRHTYCSMLVGKFRSVADTALQAGNSEDVMWANYLNLVTESEAKKFWEVRPKLSGTRNQSSSDHKQ